MYAELSVIKSGLMSDLLTGRVRVPENLCEGVAMTIVPIPAWNAMGSIPPVGSVDPTAAERSPYAVSLSDVVLRLGTSADRRRMLDGFLRYRARLHAAGLLVRIPMARRQLPGRHRTDRGTAHQTTWTCVTFFRLPTGISQARGAGTCTDAFPITRAERSAFKAVFLVDPYSFIWTRRANVCVNLSTYWYSLWSHRRDAFLEGISADRSASHRGCYGRQLPQHTHPAAGGTPWIV